MYLAIDYGDRYWLFSPTKAAAKVADSIEEAFETFNKKTFNPSNNPKCVTYSLKNGIIYDERDGKKDATILVEFPDGTTYTEFKKLYPELLI